VPRPVGRTSQRSTLERPLGPEHPDVASGRQAPPGAP